MKLKELNARLGLPATTSEEATYAALDRRLDTAARKRLPQPRPSAETDEYPREWLSSGERARAAGQAPSDAITIATD